MDGVLERIVAGLPQCGYPTIAAPAQARRHVEIYENSAIIVKISIDPIIGSHLRQRSRTTGKKMIGIDFLSGEVVIGVVKGAAVGAHGLGAEHGVIHHALHTVAVTRVSRYS